MGRLTNARCAVAIQHANGFALDRQKGDHRQFEGIVGGLRRIVTVPGHLGDDVPRGTLASIRRQSGLPRGLFR